MKDAAQANATNLPSATDMAKSPELLDSTEETRRADSPNSAETRDSSPVLSVVIPLLNEAEVLPLTYETLTRELVDIGLSYEIIFVDDGSSDGSRAYLHALTALDRRVRLLVLARNFGHEMATTAGLRHARGQAVVIMDADLQDPPALLKEFVTHWHQGYQVVYGVRRSRQGESAVKRFTAFAFYRLIGAIADVKLPADTGDFRLIDRKVLDVYNQLSEDPRFVRGLIAWVGFRQIGVPFDRQPRRAGHSKYRLQRLFKLAFDTITAFSTFPAQMISFLALGSALVSVFTVIVVILGWITGFMIWEWWMAAALAFLVLWNMQFLSLAVLGEYVIRTHRHTQQRPLYVVEALIENGQPFSTGMIPVPAKPSN